MRKCTQVLAVGCAFALTGCMSRYSYQEAYAPPAKVIIIKKAPPARAVQVVEVVKVKKRKHGHAYGCAYKDFRD